MTSSLTTPCAASPDCDVCIIGAGPVGLLLANLLGQAGVRVQILEKRTVAIPHSAAIGITPPSLHILARLNLVEEFLDRGVKVRDCFIHGMSGYLGRISFREIPDKFRWVLSLPQSETMALLEEKLAEHPGVTLRTGCDVTQVITPSETSATVEYREAGPTQAAFRRLRCRWVVACDGSRGKVREQVGIPGRGKSYSCHFAMGDFVERSSFADEAHLFFKSEGSVESFPLPQGMRRWVVQTPERIHRVPAGFISAVVKARVGIALDPSDQRNDSTFTPRRFEAASYHAGPVILCGDAAHGMSPVGGQGMNTGFADAEFLASILPEIILRGARAAPLLAAYERCRRDAARCAIFRAEWGMWLGTWQGRWRSHVRDFFMRHVMCRGPMAKHMGSLYAMLTIPFNTLERVPPALRTIKHANTL